MKALLDWLDDRTGIRGLVHDALYERIPGGARWRYVWGSTLAFTFMVQAVTGVFLWLSYSPSAQTAWESVYYIQHQMQGGWLLRGVHHFTAQAMVVLLVLHLLQVIIDGAYRAPREINFWLGLVLMMLVLALSLTGYLLPWDQKGYWATRVATNLMGLAPGGTEAQTLVVGGPDYGHHTLTRFFALHAGILPGLLVVFLVAHLAVFRRHGVTARLPIKRPECTFWPDQVLKDSIACLVVLGAVLVLVLRPWLFDGRPLEPAHLGAELGAPADPSVPFDAARPEWYFLFLFQLLKYFPGSAEVVGAIVLPGVVVLLMFLMPFLGRWKWGHRFNVAFVLLVILGGVAPLTYLAWHADHRGPESAAHLAAVADAEVDAQRAIALAGSARRIPVQGAAAMLREDPHQQGKKLFKLHCAGCHDSPAAPRKDGKSPRDGAARIEGFASRQWISGLLDPKRIKSADYFGHTRHADGEMVDFVTNTLVDWKPREIEDAVIALSAEAGLKGQARQDSKDKSRIAAGRRLIADSANCASCHKFRKTHEEGAEAPDLTGYGSTDWLVAFMSDPHQERFYDDENAAKGMPAFAPHPPGLGANKLTKAEMEKIAGYLRGDWVIETPK